ncbi:complex I assembly factor TIMMDC1, mitochondrial isoform X1 [Python bivittatus]|uniref:Complex I assembly factor TIMMDC1, mitochondrial n=1 Tax=Python bivittatus TaxID=176946 RepID=A0A9F2NCC7_PYTBI|nr:complex I assembly factor TIMMDC1, mitochondrial isoform X1 [Python bivittatus]
MERPGEGTAWPPTEVGAGSAASVPALLGAPEGSPPWLQPPDSGWERVRELFWRNEQNEYPEETINIIKATFTGGVIGLVYGGVPGFVNAKKQYIEQCKGEIYHNRLDAVQSMQRVAIRGFIRYGWRWSWRVAAFVAIFNTVNTGLSVYRDKSTLGHYTIAGACTGGLFRMHLGLRGLVGGNLIGGLLGVSAGALVMALQKVAGETFIERRKRKQSELRELKMATWRATLDISEDISEGTEGVLQEKDGIR